MSNPFDFSDFGAPRTPAGPPSTPGVPAGPGPAGPGAFDPWANQPPARPQQRPTGATDPGDAFGAAPTPDLVGGRDAFGQLTATPSLGGALATAGPPLVWFGAAIALALGGALVAGLGALGNGMVITAVLGWLLAGPAAIGALAVFNRVDTRRRAEAIYSAPSWTSTLYWVVLVLSLIGIAIGAWQIALWAGSF